MNHPITAKVPAKDLEPIDADILSEVLASPGPKGSEILAAMQLTKHTSKEVRLNKWQAYLSKFGWPEGFEGYLRDGRAFRIFNTPEGYGVILRNNPSRPKGYGVILRNNPSRYFISTFVKG